MCLSQMAVEPSYQPPRDIPLMFFLRDAVAFVGIDDELSFDAESFEGVPELEGLRGWTFAVAFADDDQRRRLHVFDERDRRAARVDGGVVVNGGAEVGDHPGVDIV